MNTNQSYLLGYLVNDQGQQFCTVYDDAAPENIKTIIRSMHEGADVWNQAWFMSPEEFASTEGAEAASKKLAAKKATEIYQQAVGDFIELQKSAVEAMQYYEPTRRTKGSYQAKAQRKAAKLVWPASNGTYRKQQ